MAEDRTPEELRQPLLEAMLAHVPFDGWNEKALRAAAADIGISPEMAELAYPEGAMDVLEEMLLDADNRMVAAIEALDLKNMRIRDKITQAIRIRLEQNAEAREAIKRGVAAHAMPPNLARGTKAGWRTADRIWRAIGDTSTDHNWYTKRATLSAVYAAVLLYWLNDDSEGFKDTWAFLDRRIENVMQFEKAKFQMRKACENMPSVSRFLGRLRYPASKP
ncbi:COQ9 family protein [Kordiimonas marina]|uniref:COQ9 family protein n=1 Tax=Kordiimonas marina TaxID=2872312 RepID=UPI001FF29B21|nr:COQ9 family protein [Kordiimonas marina]MCJ9428025.1 COQ9 family protein [Kordiimonas marina]